ncbi:MAG: YigZ family protein [Clostridia bacterium]|nr:YigZ family protein [Clostridia bacterium]
MSDVYVTVAHPATIEFEEKRSLFIGHAIPCTDEETAMRFVKEKKKEFADATHNVWAYYMKGGVLARYSDDGEPQGTAGMPTLDAIRKSGACDVCVVVTRYFGGILLGAGGLVRAYSKAAAEAVTAAGIVTYESFAELGFTCTYSDYPKISNELPKFGAIVDSVDFAADVEVKFAVREEKCGDVCRKVAEMTAGRVEVKRIGTRFDCER